MTEKEKTYIDVAQTIIRAIMREPINVIKAKDGHNCYSSYKWKDDNGKFGIRIESHIGINISNMTDPAIIDGFTHEEREKIAYFGQDIFIILHEIGHIRTLKGLSIENRKKQLDKIRAIHNYFERERAYRLTTAERRADKWAFNWLDKHPDLAKTYQSMLRMTRQGYSFYKVFGQSKIVFDILFILLYNQSIEREVNTNEIG